MKKLELSRLAPPGIDLKPELRLFYVGMGLASAFSFGFFVRYSRAYSELFRSVGGERFLIAGAEMPDFVSLLQFYWAGFAVLALCMAGLAAYHYAYHRQGSMSIYLMRRLPDRSELHRRCLALPLTAIALCAAAAILLLFVFYGAYMAFTPGECLTPHQWQKIWSVIT